MNLNIILRFEEVKKKENPIHSSLTKTFSAISSTHQMSSPEKKRTKKNPTTFLSLHDDLLLNCVARIPRVYHPTLSLVSKRIRSLIISPDLYKVRSLLNRTESCLYVCITFNSNDHRWFTLSLKPNRTLTKNDTNQNRNKKSKGYFLAKVPVPQSPHPVNESLVAVGSNIYNIGGGKYRSDRSSSTVSILDCRSHTWREGPSLPVMLSTYAIGVIDQKIYVSGWCKDDYSYTKSNLFEVIYIGTQIPKNLVEVFDTRTQIWDPKPIQVDKNLNYGGACVDGKFHLMNQNEVLSYDPKEGKWEKLFGRSMSEFTEPDCFCVIDNVLYSACYGHYLRWYDTKLRMWRELKGLVGLPWFMLPPAARACKDACVGNFVRLADYGGKMIVLWEMMLPSRFINNKKLSCAEIKLEKLEDGEIWGIVEWVDHVLTVPKGFSFVKVLAAIV